MYALAAGEPFLNRAFLFRPFLFNLDLIFPKILISFSIARNLVKSNLHNIFTIS